jgi:hypothetical protein
VHPKIEVDSLDEKVWQLVEVVVLKKIFANHQGQFVDEFRSGRENLFETAIKLFEVKICECN